MGGTGNCCDNAPKESFWHSLKVEETHGPDFATRAEAKHCVFGYIEGWYNTTRMHSSLNYKSQIQFERECNAKLMKAANDDLSTSELSTALSNNSQSARLTKRVASTLNEKWTGSANSCCALVLDLTKVELPTIIESDERESFRRKFLHSCKIHDESN